MIAKKIEPAPFLEHAKDQTVIDVRSPGEYAIGHMRGALSFPLFTNEERKLVGTCYKQVGREQAVELGLSIVGPKLAGFVKQAKSLARDKKINVYCWRGGMRSGSMAWLLSTAGLQVNVLNGGYKAFRKHITAQLASPLKLIVLGGNTGSGKTQVLHELRALGEQVIDLEGLAKHRGSAFGALQNDPQPTTEHFTNLLFSALSKLDPSRPIWVEDESRMIGKVFMIDEFFLQVRSSPTIQLNVPFEWRVKNLVDVYGTCPTEILKENFAAIQKRLGGQHFKAAVEAIDNNDLATAAAIGLTYYDKVYQKNFVLREIKQLFTVTATSSDFAATALELQHFAHNKIYPLHSI